MMPKDTKYNYGLNKTQYEAYKARKREAKLDLIWSDLMIKLNDTLRNEARCSGGYELVELGQDSEGALYVQILPHNPSTQLKSTLSRMNNLIKVL
jgi:hypothetical protein